MNKIQLYSHLGLIFITSNLIAQEKESVGTEVVNIVKSYQASVSDAFKIRETPSLEDEDNSKQEQIRYQIFSFPVASTFQPQKGSAAKVQKSAKEKLFDNYAYLGAGNYGNLTAGVYAGKQLSDNDFVHGLLTHRSSQGGIEEVLLNDQFYQTTLKLTYGFSDKNLSWSITGGYQHQSFNWYGLPAFQTAGLSAEDITAFTSAIDAQQTYQTISLEGDLRLENSFFKGADLSFNRFMSGFNSSENHFVITPEAGFQIDDFNAKALFTFDYLDALMDGDFLQLSTQSLIFGVQPSINLKGDAWNFKFGAGLFYNQNTNFNANKFYVYPDITAQLNIVEDILEFYGGATGQLNQNTYREAVDNNPWVSPDLLLLPTNQQLNAYAGLKGKFSSAVSFNVQGGYLVAKSQNLFKNNVFDSNLTALRGFEYGNSFGYVYDDINTLELKGELKADFSKNSLWTIGAQYNQFETTLQAEAWNLPSIQFHSNLDLRIAPKWQANLNAFFVGDRKDQISIIDEFLELSEETVTLKSFFDANFQLQYLHNKQLTGFLAVQNLANQSYQRFLHTPVQGLQVLLGARYKFDF